MFKHIARILSIGCLSVTSCLFSADNAKKTAPKPAVVKTEDTFTSTEDVLLKAQNVMSQFNKNSFDHPSHLIPYWHRNVKAVNKLKNSSSKQN